MNFVPSLREYSIPQRHAQEREINYQLQVCKLFDSYIDSVLSNVFYKARNIFFSSICWLRIFTFCMAEFRKPLVYPYIKVEINPKLLEYRISMYNKPLRTCPPHFKIHVTQDYCCKLFIFTSFHPVNDANTPMLPQIGLKIK